MSRDGAWTLPIIRRGVFAPGPGETQRVYFYRLGLTEEDGPGILGMSGVYLPIS